MFSQYFGQYLLNKGILTAAQLSQALEHERSVRVKLGVLAMSAGFLSAGQVAEIHQLQQTMDCKFGEIALAKGYLTEEQVEQLLSTQNMRHLTLSQTIVDKEYLNLSQLEQALESYQRENALSAEQFKALQHADIDAIVRIFLAPDTQPADSLYVSYTALLLRNIIRFLNDEPILAHCLPISQAQPFAPGSWLVSQRISGGINLYTGLIMDDATLLELARRFSEEDLTAIDELAKDSAAEFLNVHNGVFLVNKSNEGTELDLTPQQVGHAQLPLKTGYLVPITLSFGQVQLILAHQ